MEFEGSQPAAGSGRLGLVLSSAHVTIGMRTAVGLPGVAGLLVRSVQPDSPAARADLQPGDVLIKAGGRDLRSSASLYTAVRAAGTSPVQLTVLRGNDQFQTSLQLSGPVDGRSAAARGPGRAGPVRRAHRLAGYTGGTGDACLGHLGAAPRIPPLAAGGVPCLLVMCTRSGPRSRPGAGR